MTSLKVNIYQSFWRHFQYKAFVVFLISACILLGSVRVLANGIIQLAEPPTLHTYSKNI